ncbi:MAG: phospholipid carrier-dependent glycosyltransferase [Actinobacteria bacterium]|uniref:Unannotated protein n=1 Tax=freshwater metagenome TaxID=449393 RepID=A0A6J6NV99_9ZZZZ|nr:phospholipid carrier-dependent glycosyltransferase [Actinomycetota bacterium]
MLTLFARFTATGGRMALFNTWAPLAVLFLAAFLRLYNLAYPTSLVFDETYYVKDAYSLWHLGYEGNWGSTADDSFNKGDPYGLLTNPAFVVHPPLGKWLIGLGMFVFGAGNPFGWRIVVALFGIAAVGVTKEVAKIIFNSTIWSVLAGLFFAIDGVGIVLSRTGLLDQILGFFAILGFYFLLRDRQAVRLGSWNRPWLLAMGLALGAATAVKWSGLYFIAVFVLYVVLSDANFNAKIHTNIERQSEGPLPKRFWIVPSITQTIRSGLLVTVPAFFVYLTSWTGWLVTKDGWDRNWAEQNPVTGIFAWVPKALQSLWHYHAEIYNFHVNLHTSHTYASNPLTWPFMLRPTSFFWESKTSGCFLDTATQDCSSAITALGNPIIWWAAILAFGVLVSSWFRTMDKTTTLIGLGLVAGFVPWIALMNRTVFEFYVIEFEPWVILLLVAGLRAWFKNSERPTRAANFISGFVILTVLVSVFFYPIWTGMWIGYDFWRLHMWLPSWI